MASVVAATGIAGTVGMNAAFAASSTTGSNSTIVQKLADKFGLKTSDVQKVFDEDRQQHEADHEAEMKSRLDQAVKDGKLTQAQEDLLIAKHKEMKTYMDSLKDKTPAERKKAMDAKRTEMEQWLKDNNIPDEFAHPGHGPRGMHGPDQE